MRLGLRPVCFHSLPFDGRRGFCSLRKIASMMGTSVDGGGTSRESHSGAGNSCASVWALALFSW